MLRGPRNSRAARRGSRGRGAPVGRLWERRASSVARFKAISPEMGRRLLQMPGMPALLVSAATAVAFALWDPPVRDLAAHTFRADFFDQYGPGDLERHLVRRPLHAVLQRAVPAARGVARSRLGRALAADRQRMALRPAGRRAMGSAYTAPRACGSPPSRPAMLAAGGLPSRSDGPCAREPAALQRGRRGSPLLLAVLCGLASPVAALLLALVAGDRRLAAVAGTRRCSRPGAASCPVLALLFPEAGALPVVVLGVLAAGADVHRGVLFAAERAGGARPADRRG